MILLESYYLIFASVQDYVNERSYVMVHKVDDKWTGSMLLAGLPDDFNTMIKGIQSSGTKTTSGKAQPARAPHAT